jgi:3-oxoadipate enol-lactonase
MAFAERDGVRISYEISGDANLPPLVLSHALGVNMAMWQRQVEELGLEFRLLRYDTRGHGRSSGPPGPHTIAELGQDVVHLLDTLGIKQASFCGISMGGLIGQWLGIHAPQRIHKLILGNTAAKIGTEEGWNSRIATVLQEGLSSIIPGTLERWLTAEFRGVHPDVVSGIQAMLESTDAQGYVACCRGIRDADFRAQVRSICVPTLVLAGSHDLGTTPEDGRFLVERISGARYLELSAAHLSNVEAASEWNAAIRSFLAA